MKIILEYNIIHLMKILFRLLMQDSEDIVLVFLFLKNI